LSPRAFEALQLKLPDVLRKNGDELEATVGSKVEVSVLAYQCQSVRAAFLRCGEG
jgi:hypothetical protein